MGDSKNARLLFNIDSEAQFLGSWPGVLLFSVNRKGWASTVLIICDSGKVFSFSSIIPLVTFLNIWRIIRFWKDDSLLLHGVQPSFMPSELPLPSPDALSPSGLKTNSQFYSSYEGSNPRRRPSQDPAGKTEYNTAEHISKRVFFVLIYLSLC